jgi:uncharacterized protein (DUF4415 family)
MKKENTTKISQTDWKKISKMKDKDINLSESAEIPPAMFAKAIVRRGLQPISRKSQITLRIDDDVLKWYKNLGRGYQTKINTLLRAYMDEHIA